MPVFIFALMLNCCVGARPLSMGGAFIGLADDINAIYWNPAGLVGINKLEATYTYGEKFGYSHFFAAGYKIHRSHCLGLAWIDIAKWGEAEKEADYWLYISYSGRILANFSLGGNVIIKKAPDSGYSFIEPDIGILFHPHPRIGLGLLFQRSYYFRPGIALKISDQLSLTYDIYDLFHRAEGDNFPYSCFGIEYKATKNLTLRLGYYEKKFSIGLGGSIENFSFDYGLWTERILEPYLYSFAGFTLKF